MAASFVARARIAMDDLKSAREPADVGDCPVCSVREECIRAYDNACCEPRSASLTMPCGLGSEQRIKTQTHRKCRRRED